MPSHTNWLDFSSNHTVQNKHVAVDELSGSLIICIEMYDDGRVTSVHCINRLSRSESWTALGTAPCIQRSQIIGISQWYWFQLTIWICWSQEIRHIWWSVICSVPAHCREEGYIGKYISRGPRDFPRGVRVSPCAKCLPKGNVKVRGGCISQCIPSWGSVRPFSCLWISTLRLTASLLEHCQCFLREDVFLILGGSSQYTP